MAQMVAEKKKKGNFRVGLYNEATGNFDFMHLDDEEKALDLVDFLKEALGRHPDDLEAYGWDDYCQTYVLPCMREGDKGQP